VEVATAGVAASPPAVDLLWALGAALVAGGGAFAANVVEDFSLGGGEDAHAHRVSIMKAQDTAHGLFNVVSLLNARNAAIETARQARGVGLL
jgi:hypothetical protein